MNHQKSCKCDPCVRVRKIRRYNYDHGVRLLIDASPLRDRLEQLAETGVTRIDIAGATGLSERTLYMICSGTTKRVHRSTYQRIMAFKPEDADLVRNDKNVDATATRLRVQALVALGYRQGWIAEQLGRRHFGLDLGDRVTRKRALDVLDLVVRVGDAPGPSRKAAVQARNKGWRKPIEFDADLFYDPHWDGTEPDDELGAADRLRIQRESILEDYDFIRSTTNATTAEIADRLGLKRDTLENMLRKRAKRQQESIGLAS